MARPRKKLPLLESMALARPQRLFARRDLHIPVTLDDEAGVPFVAVTAENLGVSGLFLRGFLPLRIGAHVLLTLPIPGIDQPAHVIAQVARVQTRETGDIEGIGVRFVELQPSVREALHAWVGA